MVWRFNQVTNRMFPYFKGLSRARDATTTTTTSSTTTITTTNNNNNDTKS